MELHVVSIFWLGSDTSGTFLYLYFSQPSYELERPALKNADTFVQRTNIFSCKFSVKVSLMLDNLYLVPSLCILNHISLCFIQISTKSPAKLLILFMESTSIKMARVSRLSVSCDYDLINSNFVNVHLHITFT